MLSNSYTVNFTEQLSERGFLCRVSAQEAGSRKSHEIQTETHSLLPFFNLKDMEMSAQRGEG